MAPQALIDYITNWAKGQGYRCLQAPHAGEFAKVMILNPQGGRTMTVIPNAHHGRRLRKDQVRYTIRDLNINWEG